MGTSLKAEFKEKAAFAPLVRSGVTPEISMAGVTEVSNAFKIKGGLVFEVDYQGFRDGEIDRKVDWFFQANGSMNAHKLQTGSRSSGMSGHEVNVDFLGNEYRSPTVKIGSIVTKDGDGLFQQGKQSSRAAPLTEFERDQLASDLKSGRFKAFDFPVDKAGKMIRLPDGKIFAATWASNDVGYKDLKAYIGDETTGMRQIPVERDMQTFKTEYGAFDNNYNKWNGEPAQMLEASEPKSLRAQIGLDGKTESLIPPQFPSMPAEPKPMAEAAP